MNKYVVLLICSVTLSACSKSPSGFHIDFVQPKPTPEFVDKTQDVKKNFKVVEDDGTRLHNRTLQDASDVEWSMLTVDDATSAVARQGCERLGGSLPSVKDLDNLAKYLGRNTTHGFHPEYLEADSGSGLKIRWIFKNKKFWSSESSLGTTTQVLNGDTGVIETRTGDAASAPAAALCVMGRAPIYFQCRSNDPDFKLLTLRQIITRDGNRITSTFRFDVNNSKDERAQYSQYSSVDIDSSGRWSGSFNNDERIVKFDFTYEKSSLTEIGGKVIPLSCYWPRRPS